jgi:DivIVA domain-containing protein
MQTSPSFTVVLRGYSRADVDDLVHRIEDTVASGNPALRERLRGELPELTFRVTLRGYDRSEVDSYLEKAVIRLGDS